MIVILGAAAACPPGRTPAADDAKADLHLRWPDLPLVDAAPPDHLRRDTASPDGPLQAPRLKWVKDLGQKAEVGFNAVVVDDSGDVYLVGSIFSTVDFGGGARSSTPDANGDPSRDALVLSLDPDGFHRWSKPLGGPGRDWGSSLAVRGTKVVVFGSFEGTADLGGGPLTSAGYTDVFVTRFSTAGDPGGSWRLGGVNPDWSSGVAVDASGDIYVTGGFKGTVDWGCGEVTSAGADDTFVARLNPQGSCRWAKRLGGPDNDQPYAIVVGATGEVAVTGYYRKTVDFGTGPVQSAGLDDVYLVGFSTDGASRTLTKLFGGEGWDWPISLVVDGPGNLYVSGNFEGTVDFGGGGLTSLGGDPFPSGGLSGMDTFVASYGPGGTCRWSMRMGGPSTNDMAYLALGPDGHLYLAGRFSDTVDLGGGPLQAAGSDSTDILVASFTTDGAHRWSMRMGGPAWDSANGIAVDGSGNLYLFGTFAGEVDFGNGPVVAKGEEGDVFVLKLAP